MTSPQAAVPVPGRRTLTEALPPRPGASTGPGTALPGPVQAKMQTAFGADLSSVRVHVGGEASQLGAKAYAQGDNLHFAPGAYAPDTQAGQELIGHELAHVVQQRAGRVAAPVQAGPAGALVNADTALEAEADQAGARAARGEPAGIAGATSTGSREGAVVQRYIEWHHRGGHDIPVENGQPPVGYTRVGQSGHSISRLLNDVGTANGSDWVRWPGASYASVEEYLHGRGLGADGQPHVGGPTLGLPVAGHGGPPLGTATGQARTTTAMEIASSSEDEAKEEAGEDQAAWGDADEKDEEEEATSSDEAGEDEEEQGDDHWDRAIRTDAPFQIGEQRYQAADRETRHRDGDNKEWRVKATGINRTYAEEECIGALVYGAILGLAVPTELHYRAGRVRGLIVKQHIPGWEQWASGGKTYEVFDAIGLGRLAVAAWFLGDSDMHAGNFGLLGKQVMVVDPSGALNPDQLDAKMTEQDYRALPRPPVSLRGDDGEWGLHQRTIEVEKTDEPALPESVERRLEPEKLEALRAVADLPLDQVETRLLHCVFVNGQSLAALGQPLTVVAIGQQWPPWRERLTERQRVLRQILARVQGAQSRS